MCFIFVIGKYSNKNTKVNSIIHARIFNLKSLARLIKYSILTVLKYINSKMAIITMNVL